MNSKFAATSISRQQEADLLRPYLNRISDLLERSAETLSRHIVPKNGLLMIFVLLKEGPAGSNHKNEVWTKKEKGDQWIMLQRHLDYPRFMDAAPQERLALMARTFLDGILELPKARGLKRLDAKALHEALRQTLEAEGLLDSIGNI